MLDILEKKLTENQTTRKGLTTAEAEKRLSTDGENRLAKKKKTSAAKIFAGQFHDVMVMILLVSVVISVALGQYADAVPIVLIVIINAALHRRSWQEMFLLSKQVTECLATAT